MEPAVASGTELSRLTFGLASTVRSFTALRRLMPLTLLGPLCKLQVSARRSSKV
jgi:hypothetical protein